MAAVKAAVFLPPIATIHRPPASKAPSETGAGNSKQKGVQDGSHAKPLPPINYYYVSGRYKVGEGSFWNSDLNADYSSWLTHRKHVVETKGKVDNQGMDEHHARYMKFRRRLRHIQKESQKRELHRQNEEIYNRVRRAEKGVDLSMDPFIHYVENAFKKRYEYGRYLFQKKVTRENTEIQARIRQAKPSVTVEELEADYEKKQKVGAHYRKFKNLEELKVVLRKHGAWRSNATTRQNSMAHEEDNKNEQQPPDSAKVENNSTDDNNAGQENNEQHQQQQSEQKGNKPVKEKPQQRRKLKVATVQLGNNDESNPPPPPPPPEKETDDNKNS